LFAELFRVLGRVILSCWPSYPCVWRCAFQVVKSLLSGYFAIIPKSASNNLGFELGSSTWQMNSMFSLDLDFLKVFFSPSPSLEVKKEKEGKLMH
jgi:hypothetical protein